VSQSEISKAAAADARTEQTRSFVRTMKVSLSTQKPPNFWCCDGESVFDEKRSKLGPKASNLISLGMTTQEDPRRHPHLEFGDFSVLLSLMQSGVAAWLQKRMREVDQMPTWIFAGVNRRAWLPPVPLSRFVTFDCKPYLPA
tara:strand:+ start:746 stop:1171 length:426 start_codon:yes stop_codon:yes gene_type:complete